MKVCLDHSKTKMVTKIHEQNTLKCKTEKILIVAEKLRDYIHLNNKKVNGTKTNEDLFDEEHEKICTSMITKPERWIH